MGADITITVIVPIYNVEKYLVQCLESIIGQTILFDEVILINDGSTDESQLICEKYTLKYDYFKLINQENRGLSAARNAGLDHAIGDYVLFLDSDDYLRADAVKQLKAELRKFRFDAVYFDADIECEKGFEVKKNNFVRNMKELAGIRMKGESFFLKCYPENYMVPVWLAAYKRETIKKVGILFPEGLYYEDNYFTFAFIIQAEDVVYISEKLYQRRYRENSIITSVYSERKFTDYMKIILLVWETVLKQKDIALPGNRIFWKFINDYCSIGLDHRCLCIEQNITLQDNAKNEFYNMVKNYESLIEHYGLNVGIEFLNIINGILRNLKNIALYCPENKMCTKWLIKKTEQKQKQFYKKILCDLPLNAEKCKVGVYGTGKHTEGLLVLYKELVGEICCNLVFIDSYKENGSYWGKSIIHYQQIDNSFDLIIISSFLYRNEMTENVRNVNKEVPIYSFYGIINEDLFSEWNLCENE